MFKEEQGGPGGGTEGRRGRGVDDEVRGTWEPDYVCRGLRAMTLPCPQNEMGNHWSYKKRSDMM